MCFFLLFLPFAGKHLVFYVNHCRFEVFEVHDGTSGKKFLMKVEHGGTGKHEEAGLAAAVMIHFHFCEHAAFAQEVGAAVKVVRDYFHGELLPSWIFLYFKISYLLSLILSKL